MGLESRNLVCENHKMMWELRERERERAPDLAPVSGEWTEWRISEFPYGTSSTQLWGAQKKCPLECVVTVIFIPDESLLGLIFSHEKSEKASNRGKKWTAALEVILYPTHPFFPLLDVALQTKATTRPIRTSSWAGVKYTYTQSDTSMRKSRHSHIHTC